MLNHLPLIVVLAFATGVTSKFADLLNEHGVRWFRGAPQLLGVIWALLALGLTLTNSLVAAVWLSTVLFWFYRVKLDHFNHAFAGVCVIGAGLYMMRYHDVSLLAVVALTAWLVLSGELNTFLKRSTANRGVTLFLRLRLRYYAGPLALAAIEGSWAPAVAILAGMAGTELITTWHAGLVRNSRALSLPWGVRYDPMLDESVPTAVKTLVGLATT